MSNAVEIRDLTKSFTSRDGSVKALGPVDISIPRGEFLCILGPTGCGKTTLLRLIAGLEVPDSGSVTIHSDKAVEAQVGFVFQQGALFPWMTVFDNVSFPLRARSLNKAAMNASVSRILDMVGLSDFGNAHPHQLSGGMQQRVALARSLVMEPDVLLLDEPFSSLDTRTSQDLQEKMLDLWQKTGTTVIFVTHSIEEAVYLSSTVFVFGHRPGRIVREESITISRPRDRLSKEFTDHLISLRRTFEELVEGKPVTEEGNGTDRKAESLGRTRPWGPFEMIRRMVPGMFRRGRPPL